MAVTTSGDGAGDNTSTSGSESRHPSLCGCRACLDGASALATPDGADVAAADGGLPDPGFLFGAPSHVDALLNQTSSYYWNGGSVGSGASVTYTFATSMPNYYSSLRDLLSAQGYSADASFIQQQISSFSAFSTAQQNAARAMFAMYGEIANITFTEVGYNASSPGQIVFANTEQSGQGSAGYAYYANVTYGGYAIGGDVFIDNSYTGVSQGNYSYLTLLHEIGHALGLKHPGDYNGNGSGDPPFLPASTDNRRYTVMSYYDHPQISSSQPISPLLYDIAALQYVYGANTSTRTEDNTYWFNQTTEIHAIWDGGGTDRIDASNQSAACWIDLNAGSFSSIGTGGAQLNNIAIAFNCVIENAFGGWGNDTLVGNSSANTLDGGAGNDSLSGGAGNDLYIVDSTGDTVTEGSGQGTDTVRAYVNYTLGSNVENLTFMGAGNYIGVGNTLANVINGYTGIDTLSGGDGADTLNGGSGADTLMGGSGNDTLEGSWGADTIYGEDGDDVLYSVMPSNTEAIGGNRLDGGAGNDTLIGSHGDDTLIGGAGSDTLNGGALGNDVYVMDGNGSDVIIDGAGTDTVQAAVSWTLGADLENLTLTGTASINGTGNALDNLIVGNEGINTLTGGDGNDTLDGGFGMDHLIGGAGNDVYYADNTSDTITETAGGGIDTVFAAWGYTLSANIENLDLSVGNSTAIIHGAGNVLDNLIVGSAGYNSLSGGDGNDTLIGGAGNDTLVGGAGIDTLTGGTGDDTFVIDSASDVINESSGEGTDTVQSSVSWVLGAHVENLTLTGTGSINATGNALANTLLGTGGANTLEGGAGDDSLNGATGIDMATYANASGSVSVNLAAGTASGADGNDTLSLIESVHGSAFSDALLGSSDANRLIGGGGEDWIDGGSGDDTLEGGDGYDVLIGGTGNDTLDGGANDDQAYYAGVAGFVVVNLAAGTASGSGLGSDVLISIENAQGSASADTLTGSAGNNWLGGNGGNDTLDGGAGDDGLDGSDGNDTLIGGLGNDALSGGAGLDLASYATASAAVNVNLQAGTATSADGNDALSSIENAQGSAFGDTLVGSIEVNTLSGDAGEDWLDGGAGNDTLYGNDGYDVLLGGAGDDRLDGGAQDDQAFYANASGSVVVNLAINLATGAAGTDTLISIESAQGSDFADTLIGSAGNNWLGGNGGADTLDGADGDDQLDGGAGDDMLIGGLGNDALNGGAGTGDWVTYAAATAAVHVNLAAGTATGGAGNDTLAAIENVQGSAYGEQLLGSGDANWLIGNGGEDWMAGAAGNDTLEGGAGYDVLIGGEDDDTLDGGADGDQAFYANATGSVVVDLTAGTASGAAGNDTLISIESAQGSEFADTLIGTAGSNWLGGNGGNDTLDGGADNDLLDGNDGDDTLIGGAGNDQLRGGDGTDLASFAGATAAVVVNLGGGTATTGVIEFDYLLSIENAIGSSHNDTLVGTITNNWLSGADGNDWLDAEAGDDTLLGGAGYDVLVGGDGTDTLDGGTEIDQAFYGNASGSVVVNLATGTASGAAGNDTLVSIEYAQGSAFADTLMGSTGDNWLGGNAGADTLDGGDGDDQLAGNDDNDLLIGGTGNDQLNGGSGTDTASYAGAASAVSIDLVAGTATGGDGSDTLSSIENVVGSAHNDSLLGTDSANTIVGNGGGDWLVGWGGNDTIEGNDGNDVLIGGTGNDVLDGGADTDQAFYAIATGSVVVNLGAGTATGADGSDTLIAIENAQGSSFADTLTGSGGDNWLGGNDGSDTIDGSGGNDTLDAGNGDDLLIGGAGADMLNGGAGTDTFYFSGAGTGADTIGDFTAGAGGDLVRLLLVGISDFTGAQAAMSEVGGNVELDLGGGDSITFTGVMIASFDSSNFTFA